MLRNLFRRFTQSISPPEVVAVGTAVITVEVGVPVPLAVRKPEARHKDAEGRCVYGYWCKLLGRWIFDIQHCPYARDTHWVSAHAEALPETCFAPEVGS
jgi:hypothetical protein